MDTLMLEHGVRYGQTVTQHRSPITEHSSGSDRGGRSSRSRPSRDSKKAWVLCTAVRPVGTNNSKRPIPNPKAQGSDPLVHRGELQHMAAELGSYKQAHTSLAAAHPGQLQSSGGSSPSQGAGFQIPSYCVEGLGRRGPPATTAATQTTLHRPLMDLPAGGEPTGRRDPRRHFGLSPAGSRGQRPGHQALACEPQPQAWLQGGAPSTRELKTSVHVTSGLIRLRCEDFSLDEQMKATERRSASNSAVFREPSEIFIFLTVLLHPQSSLLLGAIRPRDQPEASGNHKRLEEAEWKE
ncbi:hypothetical protein L3Q82_012330 [Scortum barcoo]|uniref:Uncharacterized protein n=1 Tax=Scortum barcoo TaxID=214431 RepID=A0ACB8W2T2_9TELE|nr:hypothetical protein L3Q82_012330 [Scortum barcoo]